MADANDIDVDFSVDSDQQELHLERNFRLLRELLIPEDVHFVGAVGEPAFENGWVNKVGEEPLGFYKHNGRVYIQGVITAGTLSAASFTLPLGYRPAIANALLIDANLFHGQVVIFNGGSVFMQKANTITSSFVGVSFRV